MQSGQAPIRERRGLGDSTEDVTCFTWRWKQTQFPKRRFLYSWNSQTTNTIQKKCNMQTAGPFQTRAGKLATCSAVADVLILADPLAELLQHLLSCRIVLPQLLVSHAGHFLLQTDHSSLLVAPSTPLVRHDHSCGCHDSELQSERKPAV